MLSHVDRRRIAGAHGQCDHWDHSVGAAGRTTVFLHAPRLLTPLAMALRPAHRFRAVRALGARLFGGREFFLRTPFQVFHRCELRLGASAGLGDRGRGSIRVRRLAFLPLLLAAAPALAKDELGVFGEWAAFRDAEVPRCYAIAAAERGGSAANARAFPAWADVATWPRQGVRGQVHFRLSRELHANPRLSLAIGSERFQLTGGGVDAWAVDRAMDAAIVAAMRSASRMTLSATDRAGRRFTERYSLDGVATAMDAATVGCARIR